MNRVDKASMLPTLEKIAQIAGEAIMAVYEGSEIAKWTKSDASPLTEADLVADRMIRQGLAEAFPEIAVISEEAEQGQASVVERFFLVDPLDGTKEFLNRNGEFTVNIALIEAGRPVVGVVYAPALDTMYSAAVGEGARRRGSDGEMVLRVSPQPAGQALRVIGSRSHAAPEMVAWLEQLSEPYTFIAAGSSLKFCRIAEGSADIYPRLGPTSQWDTAAGQCIVEAAGGSVVTLAGEPLAYGLDRSILNPYFIVKAGI
jgi:3'(2'), 5'-bisphosphate nucleotidase